MPRSRGVGGEPTPGGDTEAQPKADAATNATKKSGNRRREGGERNPAMPAAGCEGNRINMFR